MRRNLPPFSNRDVVQGALALEPGENTLYSLPLLQQRFTFEGVLDSVVGQQSLVARMQLHHWRRRVLPMYQLEELPARVTGVGHQIAWVEWLDSHYVQGWHSDEPMKEPLAYRSVGWLLHDGDKAKTIAAHMTDEETRQRCGEMTIPTIAVIQIEVLR